MKPIRIAVVAGILAGSALLTQGVTNIDPANNHGWTENTGWTNWYPGSQGQDGVWVHATFLSGFAWGENIGWINLGDGTPVSGIAYANADGTDFGVNIDPPTGNLFGYAWGENIGWINFDTRRTLLSYNQQARFDAAAGRFRGYAWGENLGWINLDDASHFVAYVAPVCHRPFADADSDGDVDGNDFAVFQTCVSGTGHPAALGCECFDRPKPGFPRGDSDVNQTDLDAFQLCATGPAIPANPTCGG